ncbi:MAG: tetratricopeptide repeat protein, partial [Elusimicrobia bacterium]|nr:tetratricopeptide repeat protein [Elusimicrobiota bacterium]
MKKRSFSILLLFLAFSFVVPPARSASDERELFVVAQRAFEDGFYDVSLRYIDQLLKDFPRAAKKIEARIIEGQCYFFKKQYLKAFSVFEDLVKQSEYKDVVLFWLGETYLKAGDHARAREQYRALIQGYPASLYVPQAYYSLGWTYFEKGDYPEAEKVFLKLIELFPSNNLAEDAALKVGECEYNAGQYEGAVYRFEEYLKTYPLSTRAFEATYNIAESYYYLEQYAKAGEFYEKARVLARDPKSVLGAMVGQGWSFMKASRFPESEQAFQKAGAYARERGISDEDILLGLSSLFSAQDKHQEAIDSYSDLIARFESSPRLAESYLGRANASYQMNRFPEALADYRKILEMFSTDPQAKGVVEKARFGLAWTYLKSGDLDRSIEGFRGVLERAENKAVKVSALTQIGDAYQEAGRLDEAIATYDKILKEMPDTPYSDYVQYRLGVVLLKANRLEPAVLAFQALQAHYPKSRFLEESRYYLGVAYFKKKSWAAAADVLGAFLKQASKDADLAAEGAYLQGLCLFNLKEYPKALAVFSDIQKVHASNVAVVRNAALGIAKVRYDSGETKAALAHFKEIAFRYPGTDAAWEALVWMGQHAMTSGLYERAAEYYAQAIREVPGHEKNGVAHFELARAYQMGGRFDRAVEEYQKVTAADGAELEVKAKLAVAEVFSQEMDPEKAIETYRNIIAASPQLRRDALVRIGKVHRRMKAYDAEIKAYQDALQAPPGETGVKNAELQFLIADTYEIMNLRDKALEAYFKVPYLYPQETSWGVKAYLRVGKIY